MVGTVSGCPYHQGHQHARTGKARVHWGQKIVFKLFFFLFLFTLELHCFILLFIPFPNQNSANRDCNLYSCHRLVTQSSLCCTEESPLCVSQLSINLEPLKLLLHAMILFPSSFLFFSHLPFQPLPSSQLVDVINSGLWNVILERFVVFLGF